MNTYTKSMTKEEISKLEHKLISSESEKRKTPPYAIFQYKTSDCTITAYESGKVVFQGEGASFYVENTSSTKTNITYPQYGSDEVGTGDFFGPVVVCATQVTQEDLELIQSLKVMDSKVLSDDEIEKIAPKLMQQIIYSSLIVTNEKYNEVHKTHNMNAIKAKLHNQAFLHLEKKVKHSLSNIIIDQFTPEKNYYSYLKMEPSVIGGIHFETKAENKYLSVACASIIARYIFVQKFKELSEYYQFSFPKGAGNIVDEAGFEFVKKYGWNELNKVSKTHFKNSEKIKIKMEGK